jgi:hypothetical protein
MRDEAPAATLGGVNERRWAASKIGSAVMPGEISGGPNSFVAAEIHLGRRSAGFSDEPTALQHSSCVPAVLVGNIAYFQCVPRTAWKL